MYIHLVAKQPVKELRVHMGGGYSHKCDPLGVIIEPLLIYKKYKKVPYCIKDIKGGEVL